MTPDNTTPDTPASTPPEADAAAQPGRDVAVLCTTCMTTYVVSPDRVTLNVPAKTYQVTCSGPDGLGPVHVSTVRARLPRVLELVQRRVQYVPQGDEHRMWATVMASVVWPGEAAPQWPAATL